VLLSLAAALAIVVQDRTPLRAAPGPRATELTTLWQGEVLEVRDERAGYLKGYNYRRERGGYVKTEAVRAISLSESDAPALLAVLRFLRDAAGSEALGISYGAAYLKAAPAGALTAEPLDAIARMAERLADAVSGNGVRPANLAAHLESRSSRSSAFTCTVSIATAASRSATTASCTDGCWRSPMRAARSVRMPCSPSRGRTASIRNSACSGAPRWMRNDASYSAESRSGPSAQ